MPPRCRRGSRQHLPLSPAAANSPTRERDERKRLATDAWWRLVIEKTLDDMEYPTSGPRQKLVDNFMELIKSPRTFKRQAAITTILDWARERDIQVCTKGRRYPVCVGKRRILNGAVVRVSQFLCCLSDMN